MMLKVMHRNGKQGRGLYFHQPPYLTEHRPKNNRGNAWGRLMGDSQMTTPFLIIFHRGSAVSAHDVMTSVLDLFSG